MYNIKQAAARAGVTVPVLRAWERRYGIVAPNRTPSGYRQFDDAAIERVRSMRALVEAGWSPSAAAAAILSGEAPLEQAPASGSGPASASGSGDRPLAAGTTTADGASLAARLVQAAADLDPGAVEAVLDDVFVRGSFERAATDALFPALRALGDAWASGALSVAGEHLASAAVHRRLGLALAAAGHRSAASSSAGPVLVGMPPGARHELGALAFAVAASRAGLSVSYLGADLPVEDWRTAAGGAAAVVIGVVTRRDRSASLDLARRLRAADARLVIALGGPAAPPRPAGVNAILLPPSLTESVAALEAALSAEPRP